MNLRRWLAAGAAVVAAAGLGTAPSIPAAAATKTRTSQARCGEPPPPRSSAAEQCLMVRSASSAHTVTWDKYSLMIDGTRAVIWSGEFHPFRLPSPDLWRDVLQKLKANGYNA